MFAAALLLTGSNAGAQTLELIAGAGRYVDAPATSVPVAPLSIPFMAMGPDGKLYVADVNSRMLRFDPVTGTASALPENNASLNFKLGYTYGLAFDSNGNLHVVAEGRTHLLDPDAGTITTLPGLFWGGPLAFGLDGTLYSVGGSQVGARGLTGDRIVIAGTTEPGFSGDGGPALEAQLSTVNGIAVGPNGDLYVSDSENHRIRRISLSTGIITTFAGTGNASFNGDGRPATETDIYYPRGLAFDPAGNLFIASGSSIRRVDANTGIVSTAATTSSYATHTLVSDAAGNIYFDAQANSNSGSFQVRRLDATTGIVTHVLGGPETWFCGDNRPARQACFGQALGIDIDANQNVYVSDFPTRRLFRYSPQTGLVSVAAPIPSQLSLLALEHNSTGQLFAVSFGGYQISRVDLATGAITRVAGTGNYGYGGDGGPALNASITAAGDVEFDASDNMYIADSANNRIRKVDAATQIMSTYLQVSSPGDLEFDAAGRLVFTSSYCGVRRVDPTTLALTTIVGTGTCPSTPPAGGALATATNIPAGTRFAWDPAGNLYLLWSAGILYRVDAATGILDRVPQPPSGLQTADSVRMTQPVKMEFDAQGLLYVVDERGYLFRISGLVSDATPPVVQSNVSGTLGNNGWYRSNVQVSWTVSDAESAISSSSGCTATTVTEDTTGVSITCSATSAGGTTTQSVTIRKDTLEPYVTFGAPSIPPNAAGWYRTNVSFPWTVTDATSGFSHSSSVSPVTVTGEGEAAYAFFYVTDMAGNSREFTTPPVAIDRTPPSITLINPEAGRLYGAFTNVDAQYVCNDNLAYQQQISCVGTVPMGTALPASTPGAKTFTVTATDPAGNVATATRSYSVAAMSFERFIEPLRRSPIFNGVTAGSLVPIRWRLLDGTGGVVTNPAAFQSLNVLPLTCQGTAIPLNDSATGGPGLSVNPSNGYFTYNWQTNASWTGCRRVLVQFGDNSSRELVFRFGP